MLQIWFITRQKNPRFLDTSGVFLAWKVTALPWGNFEVLVFDEEKSPTQNFPRVAQSLFTLKIRPRCLKIGDFFLLSWTKFEHLKPLILIFRSCFVFWVWLKTTHKKHKKNFRVQTKQFQKFYQEAHRITKKSVFFRTQRHIFNAKTDWVTLKNVHFPLLTKVTKKHKK